MPNNYILLETIALTQSAASVTFDNLPTSGYTDLKIVFSTRDNNAQPQNGIFVSINGSTANFTNRYLLGSGSAASSGSIARFLGYSPGAGATANTFSNGELYFPNYRSSNNKSFSSDNVQETNASTAYMVMSAHLWSQTAAITSISLIADSASFVAGSTFSLYGIAALGTTPVLAPKATGGNIVANDGTYWYHAFTSSGNFVPQVNLTADVLQIAGGGAGGARGNRGGGGGGAGGLLYYASQSLTVQNFNVTVGAGGAIGTTGISDGGNGTNSQFGSLTASVGGGGGDGLFDGGNNGGSGGGGSPTGAGGSPTTGQGFAGGAGSSGGIIDYYGAGGGGGAGAVGSAGTQSTSIVQTGGNGGVGIGSYSTWATATLTGSSGFYAGGGGGGAGNYSGNSNAVAGTGGVGGGGNATGALGVAGTSGTAATGGGGGGANNGNAGAGGSGIVIIRYPIN